MLDTGVAPVAGLSDKIVNGPDLSLDYQDGLPESVDAYGHGTHMAGIIAGRDAGSLYDPTKFVGVAPDARIVNVKVGAADGATDVSQVIAGIDWVVQHRNDNGMNIKVLNLSFGTLSKQSYTVDPLAYAAEVAWMHGVMVVAAAGNDGATAHQLADPAYDPRILAVGAYDPNNSFRPSDWTPADFTNSGSAKREPDVFAPGMHVASLRVPGSYVDTNYPESQVGDRFTRGSGTSQATAVTAGLAADLFDRYPWATPDQIKNVLVRSDDAVHGQRPCRTLLGLDADTGPVNGAQGADPEHHEQQQRPPGLHPRTRHGIARSRPRRRAPQRRDVRAHRRAGHLRQRVEPAGVGDGGGQRDVVAGRAVERPAVERRQLGRSAVVERDLDEQRLGGSAVERATLVGGAVGRAAVERPALVGSALERRGLGRPALERPALVGHRLAVGALTSHSGPRSGR